MLTLIPHMGVDPLHLPVTNASKLDSVHGIMGPVDVVVGANAAIPDYEAGQGHNAPLSILKQISRVSEPLQTVELGTPSGPPWHRSALPYA
jgi:hypothetical protein